MLCVFFSSQLSSVRGQGGLVRSWHYISVDYNLLNFQDEAYSCDGTNYPILLSGFFC